jgi:hypothetical protein
VPLVPVTHWREWGWLRFMIVRLHGDDDHHRRLHDVSRNCFVFTLLQPFRVVCQLRPSSQTLGRHGYGELQMTADLASVLRPLPMSWCRSICNSHRRAPDARCRFATSHAATAMAVRSPVCYHNHYQCSIELCKGWRVHLYFCANTPSAMSRHGRGVYMGFRAIRRARTGRNCLRTKPHDGWWNSAWQSSQVDLLWHGHHWRCTWYAMALLVVVAARCVHLNRCC